MTEVAGPLPPEPSIGKKRQRPRPVETSAISAKKVGLHPVAPDEKVTGDLQLAQVDALGRITEGYCKQMKQERKLRRLFGAVFLLFGALQIGFIFLVIWWIGHGWLTLSESVLKFAVVGTFAEVFALLAVMVRYLFGTPAANPVEFLNTVLKLPNGLGR